MRYRSLIFIAILLISNGLSAQIGGESTYRFLSLTHSARVGALGGNQVAINDSSDLSLPYHNPALLNRNMSNQLLFSYTNYITDINYGYVSYAFRGPASGTAAFGVHYIDYGNFPEADEDGNLTGNFFKAGEYAFHLSWARPYKQWSFGATLKPVYSVFESYQSWGVAGDAGISWLSKNKLTSLGLVARNFGSQITTYYENGEREPIPFDVQVGLSRKLLHAPLTFHVTAHQLQQWDLANPEPEETKTGEIDEFIVEPSETLSKQVMRHLLLGLEFNPSRFFAIRAGYNYQLRQELKVEERLSTVGFSLGFGIRVKRFKLDYSTTRYHIAGTSSHLTLAVNLNQLFDKRVSTPE